MCHEFLNDATKQTHHNVNRIAKCVWLLLIISIFRRIRVAQSGMLCYETQINNTKQG